MRTVFSLILSAIIVLGQFFIPTYAAENYSEITKNFDKAYYERFKGQNLSINVFNWGEYMSNGTDGSLDVNKIFEELTGIKVIYSTHDTNESMYAKLKLAGSDFDIVIPSDYMVARMIKEKMLLPLNFENIPNAKYIDKKFRNTDYDPENAYSVPYAWGTVGLIYNSTMVKGEINSWRDLWNEDYRDNILMFGNPKDAFGIAFKLLGYPINAKSEKQIEDATELLKKQKPFIQAYVMDEIFDKMTGGEAAIAPYYAGDAITMISENPDLRFVVPKEGTNIFLDAMCIPYTSKNKELAEMYINFMLEPEIGRANIEFLGYSTPNTAVFDILDDEMKNSTIAYPADAVLEKAEFFYHIDEKFLKLMDEKWTEILAADENYNKMLMPVILILCVVFSLGLNVARVIKKAKLSKYK